MLVLGGGTGWVLTEILRRRPRATVLYLEASTRMLARARRRLARSGAEARVEFRHGNQNDLRPAQRFDVVVTFFVLDCLPRAAVTSALERLRASQRPGAPWLLVDFRPASRCWRRLLLRLMYAFFRRTMGLQARELPDLRRELARLGLRRTYRATFFGSTVEAAVFTDLPVPNTGVEPST